MCTAIAWGAHIVFEAPAAFLAVLPLTLGDELCLILLGSGSETPDAPVLSAAYVYTLLAVSLVLRDDGGLDFEPPLAEVD